MRIKNDRLISHIEKAAVGGMINEIVLDDTFNFSVTDDARSVLVVSKCSFPSDLGRIGLFDLPLFVKSVQYVSGSVFDSGEDIELSVVGNRLVFKKGDNELKFLLSNTEVVSTTVKDIDSVLSKIRSKDCVSIPLTKKVVDDCCKSISLVSPEEVMLSVKGGKVMFCVGKESEHNANLLVGVTSSALEVTVKQRPDVLLKVLQVILSEEDLVMEVRENYPLVILSKEYTFVINCK